MEFGVPSKKRTAVKQDKYPNTPVMTLLPFEGENTVRKMELNNKAYEAMGLNKDDFNQVAFSFNRSNYTDNAIVNANTFDSDASLKVAKNGKISNKAHYEELKTRYNVPMEDEFDLALVDSGKEFSGSKVFNLVTLKSLEDAEEKAEEVTDQSPDEVVDEIPGYPEQQPATQDETPDYLKEQPVAPEDAYPEEAQDEPEEAWLPNAVERDQAEEDERRESQNKAIL